MNWWYALIIGGLLIHYVIANSLAYARGVKAKALQKEVTRLNKTISTDLSLLQRTSTAEMLPLSLADALICVVVMNSVPGERDIINTNQPTMWLNPSLQRSWRWNHRDDVWEENTLVGRNGINQMLAFLEGDVFIHASAIYDEGSRARIGVINDTSLNTDVGQETVSAAVAGMHPEICRYMDAQSSDDIWTDIRSARQAGQQTEISREIALASDAVQQVASSTNHNNPFEDHRRAVNFDEE